MAPPGPTTGRGTAGGRTATDPGGVGEQAEAARRQRREALGGAGFYWPPGARPGRRARTGAGRRAGRPRGATRQGRRRDLAGPKPSRIRQAPPSVTLPMTLARTSSARRWRGPRRGWWARRWPTCAPGSLVIHLEGPYPGSRGHGVDVDVHAHAAAGGGPLVAQAGPAPPRSWMPTTRPASRQREAGLDKGRFSSDGCATCTDGRFLGVSLVVSEAADASAHPPMPSRPVHRPSSAGEGCRRRWPGQPSNGAKSVGRIPRQSTFDTSGRSAWISSNDDSPPTVGDPDPRLPQPETPDTTPQRSSGCAGRRGPKRSGSFITATGRTHGEDVAPDAAATTRWPRPGRPSEWPRRWLWLSM